MLGWGTWYSFCSMCRQSKLFSRMFLGTISENMYVGPDKISNLMSDGLGPYFTDELYKDIRESGNRSLYIMIKPRKQVTKTNKTTWSSGEVLVRITWADYCQILAFIGIWPCQSRPRSKGYRWHIGEIWSANQKAAMSLWRWSKCK